MHSLYVTFLAILAVGGLLPVLWRPARVFEFPQFMAATFTVFILPQAISLIRFNGRVTPDAVDDVLLMSILCLGACYLGYQFQPWRSLTAFSQRQINESRLMWVAFFFAVCGWLFGMLLARTDVNVHEVRGGMTGKSTILLFFMNLRYHGLSIGLLLLFKRFTWSRLWLVLLAAYSPVLGTILGGRREPAVLLGLMVFLGLYFEKRIQPPRLVVFAAIVLGMLAIPATGTYRGLATHGRLTEVSKIDLVGNFKEYLNHESILELRNAAAIIDRTQLSGHYEFGAGYWNTLVFRYVPAQLVGKETKDALLIGTTVDQMFGGTTAYGHEFSTGSTMTGMGDSFEQFGWLGCLVFIPIAIFFRTLWETALRTNSLFAKVLYILCCTSGMLAVTHQTSNFLPGVLYQLLFLWIGFRFASDGSSRVTPSNRPHYQSPF